MTAPEHVDILVIGHFAKDLLVIDGVGTRASGGAVFYGSVVLKRLGLSVGIVTRLHPDDFSRLDEVRQEGVQVFATAASETTGIENVYDSRDMERRICKPLGFAGALRLEDVPPVRAKVYLVIPIVAGEVDLALLKAMAARGPVGMDVQGFVRVPEGDTLVFKPWPDMAVGLSLITYLKADKAEAELLTGETDLERAARRLAGFGPKEIVLTQSSGVTVYADGRICRAPFTPKNLSGRTGRGDTCFATYVGKRVAGASPDEACRWAGAVTTLKQEQPGPWRGRVADVEALLASRS
ncbi:MAG: carbohydrate kinase [Zetaproteobacteria bacterium]|nr:MAG: carbohydrate kinase [Zetaproteobacteria bacterium]